MKRLLAMVVMFGCLLVLGGFGNRAVKDAAIDYGSSDVYTREDMDGAVAEILKTFRTMEGCELHSLAYSSDAICTDPENVAWMNELGDGENFTQCIMFDSSFRSPKDGGGSWEADEEYTWSWWLARTEGGKWSLMTWGY